MGCKVAKNQCVSLLLRECPKDLGLIGMWLQKNQEFLPVLLDYFKCREYQLPNNIYLYKKRVSHGSVNP